MLKIEKNTVTVHHLVSKSTCQPLCRSIQHQGYDPGCVICERGLVPSTDSGQILELDSVLLGCLERVNNVQKYAGIR